MSAVRTIEFAEYGVTNVHPIAMAFMVCTAALAFAPKRSTVILGVLLVCVFMPMDQRIVIGGLDFNMLRLFMVVAWMRVLVRGEYRGWSFGRLDRLLVFWVLFGSLFYVLRVGPSAVANRLGVSFDVLTGYFLIRSLVRTRVEVLAFWRYLAWIVLVLSPLFLYESTAQYNVFGIFDYTGFRGVVVRDGIVRAQGPLAHPILAGTFGSVVMPVFVGAFLGERKQRILFGLACVGATIITVSSGSSGPVMAWLIGILGWGIWRFRRYTRPMIWAIVFMAVVIHFVREQPVWQLIGRLSSISGGTGWHRARLMDSFIRRFGEWALVGTNNTAHWGWGLQDVTNQYIAEGVNGGLVTLVLFVALLSASFIQLRLARARSERWEGPKSPWALLAWGSSVSLTAHCVSFVSVSYFGQMFQLFVFFVATIPAFARLRRPRRVRTRAELPSASLPQSIPATPLRPPSGAYKAGRRELGADRQKNERSKPK